MKMMNRLAVVLFCGFLPGIVIAAQAELPATLADEQVVLFHSHLRAQTETDVGSPGENYDWHDSQRGWLRAAPDNSQATARIVRSFSTGVSLWTAFSRDTFRMKVDGRYRADNYEREVSHARKPDWRIPSPVFSANGPRVAPEALGSPDDDRGTRTLSARANARQTNPARRMEETQPPHVHLLDGSADGWGAK